jgi:hypothetical protein
MKQKDLALRTSAADAAKLGALLGGKKDSNSLDLTDDGSELADLGWVLNTGRGLRKLIADTEIWIGNQMFPGLPEHYSLRKKMLMHRSIANSWAVWDSLQIFFTLLGCGIFIATCYELSYIATRVLRIADVVVTQFYFADFLLDWYMNASLMYFTDSLAALDLLAMFPVYFMLFQRLNGLLDFFRCLRILRLVRLVQNLKFMHNTSGINRQTVYLSITLVIIIFLSSCLTHFLENAFHDYMCTYIGPATNWEPSCTHTAPAAATQGCTDSCRAYMCHGVYGFHDVDGEPKDVKCEIISFFDTFYFIIITLSTIGYGDVVLRNNYAKAAIIFFIIAAVVIIPMRLSELQTLLSLTNPYAKPYNPQNNESHVIVTGYTSDKKKLENFLKEFFHPDRSEKEGEEFHAVILASAPPTEDIRSLLLGHSLEAKVTWVLGNPVSVTDLKKVKAESASGIFFLINTDLHEKHSRAEDAANVLAALSVSNFNSSLSSFVQVLRPENGDILQDSDIEMILCLDEYKTAVQARNAVCPGFSTFIENVFHSMGSVSPDIRKHMPPWYEEYLHGAGMEMYFVQLPASFIKAMRYSFRRIAEVIYLEWECILLGMVHRDKNNVVFNPLTKDLYEFANIKAFYNLFNIGLILADDQDMADEISRQLTKTHVVTQLIKRAMAEEVETPCNTGQQQSQSTLKPKLAGVNKFRAAVNFVRKVGSNPSTVLPSPFQRADTRFSLPDANASKIKHIGDLTSMLLPSQLLHSTLADEQNESNSDSDGGSDGDAFNAVVHKPKDPDYTDDDDDDSDDEEAEDKNYIGYRLKNGQAVQSTFEGFGSKVQHANTLEEAELLNGAEKNEEEKERSSDESNSDSDSDDPAEDEDDTYVHDPGAFRLAQLLESQHAKTGEQSKIIKDASHMTDHIIVTGCDLNLLMFVGELRTPNVSGTLYHSILIVHPERPTAWQYIEEHYNDVFLLEADPSRPSVLKKMGLKKAFSISLMGARTSMNRVDDHVVNTGTLFSYLKIEQYLPSSLFVTVELSSSGNMAVLNATIMRRQREIIMQAKDARDGRTRGETLIVTAETAHKPITHAHQVIKDNGRRTDARVMDASSRVLQNNKSLEQGSSANGRRAAALFDGNGRFATKRTASVSTSQTSTLSKRTTVSRLGAGQPVSLPYGQTSASAADALRQTPNSNRRASAFGSAFSKVSSIFDEAKKKVDEAMDVSMFAIFEQTMEELWDAMDTHHVLPVFASAKAFVPSSFEALLVQSFYVKLTPIICEKFVCGQLSQSMLIQLVPKELIGRRFIDIFRLYIAHQVLCLGLLRAAQPSKGATLPYVYVSPPRDTILAAGDYVYVFSNQKNLRLCKLSLNLANKWK